MARRILNRREMRAAADAAEIRKEEEEKDEEEEGDEDEEKEEDDESPDSGEEDEVAEDEDEEVVVVVAPKKKKKAPVEKKTRTRTAKVTRLRVVWGVFNNSNQCVKTFEYPRRKDADDHAAQLTADKRSTHFVQPVKEPMEEKKEK